MNKARKPTGEKSMFDEIWDERQQKDGSHLSEISKKPLDAYHGTIMFPSLFLHILPKGTWPDARLDKDNILLGNPYEHALIDAGTAKQRQQYEQENNCSFQIFYDKQEQLKQKYNE